MVATHLLDVVRCRPFRGREHADLLWVYLLATPLCVLASFPPPDASAVPTARSAARSRALPDFELRGGWQDSASFNLVFESWHDGLRDWASFYLCSHGGATGYGTVLVVCT